MSGAQRKKLRDVLAEQQFLDSLGASVPQGAPMGQEFAAPDLTMDDYARFGIDPSTMQGSGEMPLLPDALVQAALRGEDALTGDIAQDYMDTTADAFMGGVKKIARGYGQKWDQPDGLSGLTAWEAQRNDPGNIDGNFDKYNNRDWSGNLNIANGMIEAMSAPAAPLFAPVFETGLKQAGVENGNVTDTMLGRNFVEPVAEMTGVEPQAIFDTTLNATMAAPFAKQIGRAANKGAHATLDMIDNATGMSELFPEDLLPENRTAKNLPRRFTNTISEVFGRDPDYPGINAPWLTNAPRAQGELSPWLQDNNIPFEGDMPPIDQPSLEMRNSGGGPVRPSAITDPSDPSFFNDLFAESNRRDRGLLPPEPAMTGPIPDAAFGERTTLDQVPDINSNQGTNASPMDAFMRSRGYTHELDNVPAPQGADAIAATGMDEEATASLNSNNNNWQERLFGPQEDSAMLREDASRNIVDEMVDEFEFEPNDPQLGSMRNGVPDETLANRIRNFEASARIHEESGTPAPDWDRAGVPPNDPARRAYERIRGGEGFESPNPMPWSGAYNPAARATADFRQSRNAPDWEAHGIGPNDPARQAYERQRLIMAEQARAASNAGDAPVVSTPRGRFGQAQDAFPQEGTRGGDMGGMNLSQIDNGSTYTPEMRALINRYNQQSLGDHLRNDPPPDWDALGFDENHPARQTYEASINDLNRRDASVRASGRNLWTLPRNQYANLKRTETSLASDREALRDFMRNENYTDQQVNTLSRTAADSMLSRMRYAEEARARLRDVLAARGQSAARLNTMTYNELLDLDRMIGRDGAAIRRDGLDMIAEQGVDAVREQVRPYINRRPGDFGFTNQDIDRAGPTQISRYADYKQDAIVKGNAKYDEVSARNKAREERRKAAANATNKEPVTTLDTAGKPVTTFPDGGVLSQVRESKGADYKHYIYKYESPHLPSQVDLSFSVDENGRADIAIGGEWEANRGILGPAVVRDIARHLKKTLGAKKFAGTRVTGVRAGKGIEQNVMFSGVPVPRKPSALRRKENTLHQTIEEAVKTNGYRREGDVTTFADGSTLNHVTDYSYAGPYRMAIFEYKKPGMENSVEIELRINKDEGRADVSILGDNDHINAFGTSTIRNMQRYFKNEYGVKQFDGYRVTGANPKREISIRGSGGAPEKPSAAARKAARAEAMDPNASLREILGLELAKPGKAPEARPPLVEKLEKEFFTKTHVGNVSPKTLQTAFNTALDRHLTLPPEERVAHLRAAERALSPYLRAPDKDTLTGDYQKTSRERPIPLLAPNAKMMKSAEGYRGSEPIKVTINGREYGVETTGLSLSPSATIKGFQTCANSASCREACLGLTSGNRHKLGGGEDLEAVLGPRLNSLNKTRALLDKPEAFATVLFEEIAAARREAEANGNILGIRLNVLSDVSPRVYEKIIKAFPDVIFYDYTKMPYKSIAPNHHYTYSSTGVSNDKVSNLNENWSDMRDRLEEGHNVAMSFSDRENLPETVTDKETGKTYTVIDGDKHDFRPLDIQPKGKSGVIVGLRNKKATGALATASQDNAGFFVDYDPKNERLPPKIGKNGKPSKKPGNIKRGEPYGYNPETKKPYRGNTFPTNKHVEIMPQNVGRPKKNKHPGAPIINYISSGALKKLEGNK